MRAALLFARQGRRALRDEGSAHLALLVRVYRVARHAACALGYGLVLLAGMFVAPFYRALTWRPRHAREAPTTRRAHDANSASPDTPSMFLTRALWAGRSPGFSLRVMRPDVESVEVGPKFGEPHYAPVFALLQTGPRAKLLDLRAATAIKLDLFERLADAWKAPPGTVRRLGVLLGYESWVVFRNVAARRLRPLVDRGVKLEIFYGQQAESLPAWFAEGRVHHDQIRDVIEWLRTQWRPTAIWPTVLNTTAMIVQASAAADQGAELLLELAAIALSFEGAEGTEQSAKHARAAVLWVGDRPSRARCRALRTLATATFRAGESEAGLAHLEAALTAAMVIQDPIEEASALAELGFHALRRGHAARAEVRFRSAIALLSADGSPYLLATLHHNLADVLHQQGKEDAAEHHAHAALSLRWDPESRLAAQDRGLLSRIRPRRGPLSSDETSTATASRNTTLRAKDI